MIKVGTKNSPLVCINGYITLYAAPKAHTVYGDDVLCLAVHVAYVKRELTLLHRGAVAEESSLCAALCALFDGGTITVDDHVGCDYLIICLGCLSSVDVTDVERSENLLLLVESHVLVLLRLECRRHECKQERNDNYDNDRIYDCVGV